MAVNVENFHRAARVRDFFARDDFQIADQLLGFLAPVRFDPADDHVHARLFQAMRLFEHRVGLADPRRVAEINLQLSQAAPFDEPQEILRLQPVVSGRIHAAKKLFPRRRVEREVETPLRDAGRCPHRAEVVFSARARARNEAPTSNAATALLSFKRSSQKNPDWLSDMDSNHE